MDIASCIGQAVEVVRRELASLRAACSPPYPRIERAENVAVADVVCKGTGDV
jgi:hypothetical protein